MYRGQSENDTSTETTSLKAVDPTISYYRAESVLNALVMTLATQEFWEVQFRQIWNLNSLPSFSDVTFFFSF